MKLILFSNVSTFGYSVVLMIMSYVTAGHWHIFHC